MYRKKHNIHRVQRLPCFQASRGVLGIYTCRGGPLSSSSLNPSPCLPTPGLVSCPEQTP